MRGPRPLSVTPPSTNHPQVLILLLIVVAQWQKRQFIIFFLTVLHKCNAAHLQGGNRGPPARRLVQGKQQIVDHVCPKFSHDGDAICTGIYWGG
jgi:hypothetical protein